MFVPRFSINYLNLNYNPYLAYTYDSSTGIYSVETNACYADTNYFAFQFIDKSGCPATYPYKDVNSDLCYDCVGYSQIQISGASNLFVY